MKRVGWVLLPILAFMAGAAAMAGWHGAQTRRAPTHQASAIAGARIFAAVPAATAGDGSSTGLLPDDAWPQGAPTPEQVMYAQPALVSREAAKLKPRTPDK
ncbi:MAG TPA: hypothetical protein VJQ42_02650, partial [Rhodanobacteraceae bacterium]|nr:hypothetical protein [Rhodanobacteraceae bacterium]